MSKQKQFNNRLNDLFADMSEDKAPITEESHVLPGWTWQCDAVGYYIACDPEVEDILGHNASSFIGQLLTQYQLSTESSTELMAAMGEGENETIEITLQFKSKHGETIPIRSKIYRQNTDSGEISGWNGFAQTIKPLSDTQQPYLPDKSPTLPSQKTMSSPSAVKPHTASQNIGLAIDGDQTISVSSPYSGAGKQSLKQQQTVSYPSAPGIEAALAVPIPMTDKSIGLLEITDTSPGREWSQEEQLLVEEVAEQLSLAMENARLFEETQISLNRTEALFEVSRASIAFEDTSELLQSVVDTITAVLPANRTLAVICNIQKEEISYFLESNALPISIQETTFNELMNGLTGWCLREQKPALSLKGSIDPRASGSAQVARLQSQGGSIVVVPMIYREQVFGTLTAINTIEQPDFTQNDVDLLSAMSNQVATALANANSFQEEQRRRRIAATLSEIARVIGGSLELKQIGERLLGQLGEVVAFSTATLQIVEDDHRETIGEIRKDGRQSQKGQIALLRPISEDPLIRSVVESKEPLYINNTATHSLWEPTLEKAHIRSWLAAPLIQSDRVIGLLTIENTIPNAYDDETSDLLSGIAAQAAVALHNAQLYQQAQSRSTQLQTAAEVSRAASGILDPNPLIEQTVNLIRDRFDLYYVGVFLIDETGTYSRESGEWAVLRAGTGEAGRIQIERNHKLEVGGTSMIGQCIETAQSQISQQVRGEDQRFVNPLLPETRSELALPLISRGMVTGAMTIQSTQLSAFLEEDIAILQTMADQVANALQNASLFDQTQIRAEELAVLNEMSRQLTSTVETDVITRNIYLFTSRLIDTSTFFIALYDKKTDSLNFPFATEENQEITIDKQVKNKGLTKYVVDNREPLLITEDVEDWMSRHQMDFITVGNGESQMAQSWLGVPMLAGDDVIGIINVQHKDPRHYGEQEQDLLIAIASQGAIAFQNAGLFAETRQRTEDLALLNEMSAILSNALDIDLIVNTVHEYTSRFMETANLFIALYEADTDEVHYPINITDGERLEVVPSKLKPGFTSYLLRKRQPILLNGDMSSQMEALGIKFIPLGNSDPAVSFAGAPLLIGDQAIGAIAVQSTITPYLYQERHRDLLTSIAAQAAIAIQNANLFNETQQRTEDLDILNEMSRVLATLLDIDEVLRTIYEYTTRLMDTTHFFISLYDADIQEISMPYTINDNQRIEMAPRQLGNGLSDYIIRNRQHLLINNNMLDRMRELGVDFIPVGDDLIPVSWLGVPMMIGERVIGVIAAQSLTTPYLYQERQRDLLASIASQGAITIQNTRLFAQTQEQLADLTNIQQTTSELSAAITLDEVVNTLLNNLAAAAQVDTISIFLLRGNNLERMGMYPAPDDQSEIGTTISLDDYPLTKQAIETRTASASAADDPQLQEHARAAFKANGISANMTVPLIGPEGPLGSLSLNRMVPAPLFDPQEVTLIETLATQAGISLQNALLFEQTNRQLRDLETISSASQTLSSAPLETNSVAEIIAQIFIELMGGNTSASISLLESGTSNYMRTYVSLRNEGGEVEVEYSPEKWDFDLSEFPATARVMEDVKPLVVRASDPDADPNELAYLEREFVNTLVIFPLAVKGQSIGVIELEYRDEADDISSEELTLGLTLANQAAVALENARLYIEQRETAEQLREVDTLKSQFLANMSHELRTPLNSIIGFSRVIMKGIDGPVTDLQQQDLSAIYNAGQHLLNMINDILDISKIEAGKMELAFDDVELSSVIDSVLSTARGLVKDKQVKLTTDIDDDIPIITADPTRIRQILLNLISNSAKFTDDGSITVIARKRENKIGRQEIYLAVTDTGSGIADEDQHKLFVPFSQVDGSPTRKVEGTGLGLSITRLLVDLHGGEIGVDSEIGKGSTFWFTLPLPESNIQTNTDGNLTVLAIDDDSQVITLYERYLKDAGYQVIAITDPHDALEQARHIKPYAITLDIMMPDFDGWKLLEDLKNDPDVGKIPVVICSILAEHDKGMKLGASNYLTKPILEDDLVHSLNKLREEP